MMLIAERTNITTIKITTVPNTISPIARGRPSNRGFMYAATAGSSVRWNSNSNIPVATPVRPRTAVATAATRQRGESGRPSGKRKKARMKKANPGCQV
jgi:hypothetical protein